MPTPIIFGHGLRRLNSQGNIQESEDLRGGGYFKHSFLSKNHDEGLGTACIYFVKWQLLT